MTKRQIATPAAPVELIVHEWDQSSGDCKTPEKVSIQLAKDRTASVFLGAAPDGTWRFGYYVEAKAGDESAHCRLAGNPYNARVEALSGAIEEIRGVLEQPGHNDKAALKAIEAFVKSLGATPLAALVERAPANPVAVLGALPKGRFAEIPVGNIQANPENPRKSFDPVAVRELADSIQAQGLLQPIAVRRMLPEELGENPAIAEASPPERYEIILGERRWRAAQLPKRDETGLVQNGTRVLEAIDAKVYEGVTRAQAKAAALVENLQREKMNAIEEAEGFRDLINSTTPPLTQEAAAEMVGKSRPVVANALRVLELPEVVIEYIREGKLTLAHGVALARFKAYPKAVAIMARRAVEEGAKASQLERGVPYYWELTRNDLAVHFYSHSDGRPSPAFVKKHAGKYFGDGEGGVVCLDPEHWKAEAAALEAERKKREAEEAEAAAAKLRKAEARGKLKDLSELKHDQFRKLEGVKAGLVDLLPETAKAVAKDYDGKKVEIATDVALAERLEAALKREIKKDRRKVTEEALAPAVRNYLAKLKKVGAREMAQLLAEIVTYPGTSLRKYFGADACKAAGIRQPAAFREDGLRFDDELEPEDAEKGKLPQIARELRALERLDSVTLFRVIAEERLVAALEHIVEHGPQTPSAYFVRWMLERDDLGLLEETPEGRSELLDRVKAAKWYQHEIVEGKAAENEPSAQGEAAR